MASLKERYAQLESDRLVYLDRARQASKLSIPTLFPPDSSNRAMHFPTPWQSMGARCVNNLASKLLLALFPPNAPFFRLQIDDFNLAKLTKNPAMKAEVDKALNRVERAVMMELETSTARPSLFETLKQLIVGGNSLIVVAPDNRVRVFKLDRYVCKRDPMGNPLETITKECLSPLELGPELRAFLGKEGVPSTDGNGAKANDDVDLYTGWKLVQHGNEVRWDVHQEIDGKELPGSRGFFPKDKCPARPLRLTSLDGEDYGRGMFEEYMGDFKSLEGLQKAIVQGSAAAAKVLFLVKPNSTTKKDTIAKSESGAVESGNAEDVSVLQMEKYNDFRVALETRNGIIQSLAFAFMLNTAIQRQGERVTAEEIRYMAQELETALGGVYSTMSQDLQLPLCSIIMSNMERASRLPALPKGAVKPAITTGIDAIGRGNDLDRLTGFLRDLEPIGPEAIADYLIVGDYITRAGTARQINMDGLVRSEDEVMQRQQQRQMMELAQRAAPNAVNKAGDMMAAQQQGTPANG